MLTERPVGEVCPIERGRNGQPDRAAVGQGQLRVDGTGEVRLPGPGILAAIQYTFDLVEQVGERWTLDTMPKEEAGVYDMLCRADSIGVFQVESRAQVGTLATAAPQVL